MYGHSLVLSTTEKNQTGYVVSTGSGQTLQKAPKIPELVEIMKNQATEPIVAYLLLWYLLSWLFWAEIKCTVDVALSKLTKNLFGPVRQSRNADNKSLLSKNLFWISGRCLI